MYAIEGGHLGTPTLSARLRAYFPYVTSDGRESDGASQIITTRVLTEGAIPCRLSEEDIRRDRMSNRRLSDCRLASAGPVQIVDATRNATAAASRDVKTPKRPRRSERACVRTHQRFNFIALKTPSGSGYEPRLRRPRRPRAWPG